MTPTEPSRAPRRALAMPAWLSKLVEPVDVAWLAAFRIAYGLVLCVSMLRFLAYGWVERFFVTPRFHFKYWGFEWVEPLSAALMHALFWALAGLSLCIAAGAAFRIAALLFALGVSYFQLIDVSTYLNHYYLAALLAWLLAVSPANAAWSVDAWWRARRGRPPASSVPAAWLYCFRFQVGVVYFFAGIAKLQPDWLLHAQPLRIWLGASTELPVIGSLFTRPEVPLLFSWFGFLFDLTIVFWLSWKRTRPWAYAVVLVFHAMTRVLFPIGMFPVIMVLAALVFFEPDWPMRLLERLRPNFAARLRAVRAPAVAVRLRPAVLASLAVGVAWCVAQLALPLRSFYYGGNVLWHEQGMRFSWRVMVRAKGGSTTFVVRNLRSGETWHVTPDRYLNGLQESEMSGQPDLILQLAHHVREDFERQGRGPVAVFAESRVALNGRRGAAFIDPDVNLVAVHDGLERAEWVLPAPASSPPHTRPVL